MEDIRRIDQRLWAAEALRFGRVAFCLVTSVCLVSFGMAVGMPWIVTAALVVGLLTFQAHSAYQASVAKRFRHPRFLNLHKGILDRLDRFEEVLDRLKTGQVSDLNEMPKTIRKVGNTLYNALRRADIISAEILDTESGILNQPPVWRADAQDPRAQELYRMADKNIAEYRHQYQGVMAGVNRVEAQAAVFMTTLDTIRMKLIGYSLTGRQPELSHEDFVFAIGEAKMQLHAIDLALEELDFSNLSGPPTSPPPPPVDELRNRLGS